MQLKNLKPNLVVYDVGTHKMGNTNTSTVAVWSVLIIAVNEETRVVKASWNCNPPRDYDERTWSKWRLKKPELVSRGFGHRLKRRGE